MRFFKDKKGKIEKIYRKVIRDNFPELEDLKFVFVWRKGEKYDEDGYLIIAQVRKLSNRDRDIFGYDLCIETDIDLWKKMSLERKKRVAYHELSHVKVFTKEDKKGNIELEKDEEGRYKIKLLPHDLVLKKFKNEIRLFGLTNDEEKIRKILNKSAKKKAV